MTFPASQELLASGLQLAKAEANKVRLIATETSALSAVGDIDRQRVVDLMRIIARAIDNWGAVRTLPGIGQYAKDQFGNAGLDIAAEFTTMEAAAVSVRDWIFTNFPKDATSGAWLLHVLDNRGAATSLSFTTAQLDQFRTRIAALVATIG